MKLFFAKTIKWLLFILLTLLSSLLIVALVIVIFFASKEILESNVGSFSEGEFIPLITFISALAISTGLLFNVYRSFLEDSSNTAASLMIELTKYREAVNLSLTKIGKDDNVDSRAWIESRNAILIYIAIFSLVKNNLTLAGNKKILQAIDLNHKFLLEKHRERIFSHHKRKIKECWNFIPRQFQATVLMFLNGKLNEVTEYWHVFSSKPLFAYIQKAKLSHLTRKEKNQLPEIM